MDKTQLETAEGPMMVDTQQTLWGNISDKEIEDLLKDLQKQDPVTEPRMSPRALLPIYLMIEEGNTIYLTKDTQWIKEKGLDGWLAQHGLTRPSLEEQQRPEFMLPFYLAIEDGVNPYRTKSTQWVEEGGLDEWLLEHGLTRPEPMEQDCSIEQELAKDQEAMDQGTGPTEPEQVGEVAGATAPEGSAGAEVPSIRHQAAARWDRMDTRPDREYYHRQRAKQPLVLKIKLGQGAHTKNLAFARQTDDEEEETQPDVEYFFQKATSKDSLNLSSLEKRDEANKFNGEMDCRSTLRGKMPDKEAYPRHMRGGPKTMHVIPREVTPTTPFQHLYGNGFVGYDYNVSFLEINYKLATGQVPRMVTKRYWLAYDVSIDAVVGHLADGVQSFWDEVCSVYLKMEMESASSMRTTRVGHHIDLDTLTTVVSYPQPTSPPFEMTPTQVLLWPMKAVRIYGNGSQERGPGMVVNVTITGDWYSHEDTLAAHVNERPRIKALAENPQLVHLAFMRSLESRGVLLFDPYNGYSRGDLTNNDRHRESCPPPLGKTRYQLKRDRAAKAFGKGRGKERSQPLGPFIERELMNRYARAETGGTFDEGIDAEPDFAG